jgi:hypothetical protein
MISYANTITDSENSTEFTEYSSGIFLASCLKQQMNSANNIRVPKYRTNRQYHCPWMKDLPRNPDNMSVITMG